MKIYGLTSQHINDLKKIAFKKIGKSSVSSFAKHLLLQQLLEQNHTAIDIKHYSENPRRLELRLAVPVFKRLKEIAEIHSMTVNRYSALILHDHITCEPTPTVNEVQVLRESNYQLYKLGVNLNQVAKALNSTSATSLSLKEVQVLQVAVDEHIRTVGKLLQATRRRL